MTSQNIQLSPHFHIREFAVSSMFPLEAEAIEFSDTDISLLTIHSLTILEPIRSFFNIGIRVLSGKRTAQLNNKIGGERESDHLMMTPTSCAVDWCFTENNEMFLSEVYKFANQYLRYSIGQFIYYPDKHFIHISLPTAKHRNEFLQKKEGVYSQLIL